MGIKQNNKNRIKFSLVIPLALYRDAEILNSIKKLDYDKKKYEVIIEKGKNPSENRNRGVGRAKGEIIIFLDDDAVLEKDFLKNVESFFEKYNIDIAGGPQLTPKDDGVFARVSGYAFASVFGGFGMRKRYKKTRLNLEAGEQELTSAVLCCKKRVFNEIGFNPELWPGEDPDFINQAKKKGFAVAYSPDIFIYHRRRPDAASLAKQIFSYGKVRPKVGINLGVLIPSIFLIYLLVLPSLSLFNFIFVIPFLAYIIINLVFSIFTGFQKLSFSAVLYLPIIFFIIHTMYGLGFAVGFIQRT